MGYHRQLTTVLAALLLICACAQGAAQPQSQPRTLNGTLGKAAYAIEVPAHWNGTLFLYSHGYVAPGQANGAVDAPGPDVASWLLGHGYAVAGSSYSSTGWAVEDATTAEQRRPAAERDEPEHRRPIRPDLQRDWDPEPIGVA